VAESCPLSPTLAGLIPQAIQRGERRHPFPAMGLQMEIAAMVPSIAPKDIVLTGIALAAGAVTLGVPARAYAQTAGRLDPVFSHYPAGERPLKIANLNDLEEEASRVLPREAFAYIAAGSDNQWTVHQNRRASTASYFDPSAWLGRTVSPPSRPSAQNDSSSCCSEPKRKGYFAVLFTIDGFATGGSDETTCLAFSCLPELPLVNSKTPLFKKSRRGSRV